VALKLGTAPLKSAAGKSLPDILLSVAASPFIWIGLGIYTASVLCWIWVLSKTDVSVAYPFVGLGFVLTAIMGAVFLHENVSPLRIAGTLLVIFGCVLIAKSA
jgi:multidrug transporter EmrE-like cation transporter